MASNYTENLNLCQWAAEDPVLRTEFNADNAKLDAALGALADRPAIEIIRRWDNTTLGNQINIDLSDIDLSQYLWLRINFQHIPVTSTITAAAYINGLKDNSIYQTLDIPSTTGMSATTYAGMFDTAKPTATTHSLSGEFEFDCTAPWLFGRYRAFYYNGPEQRQWHRSGYWSAFPEKLKQEDVTSLQLAVMAGSGTLASGGQIMIYGQKLNQK